MRIFAIVLSYILSFLLTISIVYSVKAAEGEGGFWESLLGALRLGAREFSDALVLLLKSLAVVSASLIASAVLGYSLARFEVPRWLKLLLSFPEIFTLVVLDLIVSGMGFRIRGLSETGKFLVIFLVVSARRWLVFHDYFRISLREFEESTAYKLMLSRKPRNMWKYRLKNTVLDSISSLTFEIPLMISYVAIIEQVITYSGISLKFLKSLEDSITAQLPMLYAIFISASFIAVQIVLRWLVYLRDKRSVGL